MQSSVPDSADPSHVSGDVTTGPRHGGRRWGWAVAVLPALLVIILVVAGIVARSGQAAEFDAAVTVFDVADRHDADEPVAYDQTPPVAGYHAPMWQRCGVYARRVPDERAVHSLKRGAVWITYRPGASEDDVATLAAYARSPRVLVSPYPDLPSPVVVTAWERQLWVSSAGDWRVGEFIRRFQGGASAPEGDVGCQGGTAEVTQ